VTRLATQFDGVVVHARQEPIAHRFRYRTRMWLVDLSDLPVVPRGLRWAASFRAADHIGDPEASLGANITAAFARDGIDVNGCRLLMLANARGLGHGFNPISVHWAVGDGGEVRAVMAEVHNTYGGRHAYVLRPDAHGRDVVRKQLYVSPFYAVDGHYSIRISPPEDHISVSVTLHPPAGKPFVATLHADRRNAIPAGRAALRTAAASWRTSALIRRQGLGLLRRGLRVQPRPTGHSDQTPELSHAGARND
jgi:DUF1365 family protein